MEKPTLPAAQSLINEIRALYAKQLEPIELWQKIEVAMRKLLVDPTLKARAQEWPTTVESAPTVRNLLLYEDPNYGFVFNATVRQSNVISNIHDHGDVWTLYGLIDGQETILHYDRVDETATEAGSGKLKLVGRYLLGPGEVDVVPPGKIHQEYAGPQRSVSFIIRAKRPGTFKQHYYNLETGACSDTDGPQQVKYSL
jgi:predicted metal-dependent enzyme (double-stranded beta helix superfamily)